MRRYRYRYRTGGSMVEKDVRGVSTLYWYSLKSLLEENFRGEISPSKCHFSNVLSFARTGSYRCRYLVYMLDILYMYSLYIICIIHRLFIPTYG